MASIIADLSDDIKKMKSLKEEIQQVKRELGSINVKVELDIKRDMEARLKALTGQYDALVQKVAQAEARIAESTSRINKSAETIIKAQEQITKSASGQSDSSIQGASGGNSAATNTQTASVQAQAKAYDELAAEINKVIGTREQNIRKLVEEQNAIKYIQKQIANIYNNPKDTTGTGKNERQILSEAQVRLLGIYNKHLLEHKVALSQVHQILNNEQKLYDASEGSMQRLSQELGRMRIAYRRMTDEQKASPFGQELLASIEQADAKIKQLDASIGNHQRNVGNYASGWNGLNMSIQQIGRELPSLAMGWNTFFLAISNNLPILTDEIKRAKDEYNALKAAGQQATPVWKQVVSSLLSWQTALTVGITLLTLYGKEIANWVSGLFSAKKALSETFEASENFHNSVSKSLGSVMSTFENLSSQWSKLGNDIQSQNKFISENKEEFDKLGISVTNVADAENILSANKDKFVSALLEKAKAAAAMDIAAGQYEKAIKKMMEADNAQTNLWDRVQASVSRFGLMQSGNYDAAQGVTSKQFTEERRKKYQQQSEDALKEAGKIVQKYAKFSEKEQKILEEIGIKSSEQMVANSVEAINASIALKQEALNKVTNRKDYARIEAEIKAEQAKLNAITGGGKEDKEKKDLKRYLDELTKLREDNEDRQVELMEDGTEKQIAEIKLRYKRMREKVQELENNLYNSQGGKLTKEQSAMFNIAYTGIEELQSRDERKATEDAVKKRIQAEREDMRDYLKEYGSYQEKRLAITEEYQQKISEAGGEDTWEGKILARKRDEDFSDLDIQAAKTTSSISKLFGDMTDKTLSELKKINEEGSAALDFLKGGEWNEEKGMSFGITQEQFNTLSKSPEMLKAISDALRENQAASDALRPSYEKVKDALNDIFNAGNNSVKLKKALSDLQEGLNEIMQAAQFLSDTFSNLGDAFGSDALSGIAEGINVAMGALNAGMQGAQAGAMFGPIGSAAGAALGVVSSLAGAIAKIHDKKNEKRIQRLQDQIDTLTSSYDKLGRAVEDAYSKDASDLIEQQNKLLEQQKVLIEQQIREEEDKKNTDEGRIKEWRQQIEEINQTIEDNKEAAVDAIFGEDLQSAIENFADAYAEAWANGEDKAESAKDTVKKMMQQMVTESIKAAIQSSGAMEEIRNKLQQFYADNVLTGWEQDYIYNMAEELQKELDEQFGWADSLFGSDKAKEQQSASSGGFETMTQDQASELNGRFTALNESSLRQEAIQQGISNIADDMRNIIAQSYLELQQISENTGAIIVPIQKMQKDMEIVKQNTSRI